jgi:hypothetical protein
LEGEGMTVLHENVGNKVSPANLKSWKG